MNPAIRLIRSAELSAAPYAYASVVDSGVRLVFLAGACPLEKDGTTAAVGDYVGQAAKCIETLREALRAVGATLENVVNTRILVASSQRSDLGVVWEIVRDAFGDHDVPSTLMGVTVLGYEDQLVEIEAIAAVSG
ncbi:RidA family protein [Nocardioides sp. YIM B13467]|uniref:RidA family protein n=1 Tax=Nocardioides sp. YIM B13467 TaxID=3366294 RepID=UPI00367059E0